MNEPSNFCEWPCENPEQEKEGESTDIVAPPSFSRRQSNSTGSKKGLPDRNLIDPPYKIDNEMGSISNKTARTDLVHQGGWVEYDTHNL